MLGKALLSGEGWGGKGRSSSQLLEVPFEKAWTFKVAFKVRVRVLDFYMENIFSEGMSIDQKARLGTNMIIRPIRNSLRSLCLS